ncbi:Oidioi.mRNA.OKI2018_I69.chr2.g5515.t1.cds [Oikopleura dioica]|uniref:Oidioi.mRNA.OKI2018_I69.chr2.g5515.t1.cds n=1 Tax=Oikopleura dioica TaxID=34765 RepID=A0ABN7T130_OIKDI|nr:Oidioi.mRNA.OKI2018_I69.chr2.g5515.t1.cds [Oikopleura dioica]
MKLFWLSFNEPTTAPSLSEKKIAGEDVFNCLQKRMDAVCSEVSEGVYPFARKSDAFADWYCYAGFDDDLEISNECILWAGRPKAPCTPFMLDGYDTLFTCFFLLRTEHFDFEESFIQEKTKFTYEDLQLTADLGFWNQSCKPQEGAIFHKKHKTGSTTFKNLIDRYFNLRNMFSLVEEPHMIYSTGCYPAKFNKNGSFAVKIFTSVRDPLATFRSAFNYFYSSISKRVSDGCNVICWEAPFESIVRRSNSTFENEKPDINEFLSILPENYDAADGWNFRVRNLQSYEMGLDMDKMDDFLFVKQYFEKLDTQYDLVLIQGMKSVAIRNF